MRKILLIISLLLVTGIVRAEKSAVTASPVAKSSPETSPQQKPSSCG